MLGDAGSRGRIVSFCRRLWHKTRRTKPKICGTLSPNAQDTAHVLPHCVSGLKLPATGSIPAQAAVLRHRRTIADRDSKTLRAGASTCVKEMHQVFAGKQ